jgi:hypothetical protein
MNVSKRIILSNNVIIQRLWPAARPDRAAFGSVGLPKVAQLGRPALA